MQISFHFESPVILKNRLYLKAFLRLLAQWEKQEVRQIKFIFCSDDYLLQINRQFLNHDYYTDIISFNLAGSSDPVDGEIYISIDRVKENAKRFEISMEKELLRVIFHGLLHFAGYKDKTSAQKAEMSSKEDLYLEKYYQMFHVEHNRTS